MQAEVLDPQYHHKLKLKVNSSIRRLSEDNTKVW